MKKSIFAICDGDKLYAGKIYEYIHSRLSQSYEVILFTETEACEKYMEKEKVNILLISDTGRAIINGSVNADNIVILSSNCRNGTERDNEVYKYQSAEKVLKRVMEFCSTKNSESVRRNATKPLSIIGVYTPIKRSFQTTFSIALGQILSKTGKTLYVNFESFSGFDHLFDHAHGADLMDLVYFWKVGGENFSYRLESVIDHIGALDYVPPAHSFMNFNGISGEQWLHFLRAFEIYTDYEYLILDLSENVTGMCDVLRMCKTVYTLTDQRRISRAKLSQYEALLREYNYEDVLGKTRELELPLFREIPDDFEMLPYSELTTYIKNELSFAKELMDEAGIEE